MTIRPPEVRIRAERCDGIRLLRLEGELTLPGAAPLLVDLAARLCREHGGALVCDLDRLLLPGRDAALALFPAALRRAGGWPGASLHLHTTRPDLLGRLRGMRLHRFLPVHPDLDSAMLQARLETPGRLATIDLPAMVESPARARALLGDVWPHRPDRQVAEVVLSELVTNAVEHTGRPCTASILLSPTRSLLAVTDRSSEEIRRPAGDDGDCRGLRLVERLSLAWGYRLVHPEGKTVWAALPAATVVPLARPPSRLS